MLSQICSMRPSKLIIFPLLLCIGTEQLMNSRGQRAAARAWNKNTVALFADVLPVFRYDLTAGNGHDWKSMEIPSFVYGIVLPSMKIAESDGSLHIGVDNDDVGVAADRHDSLAR